MAASPEQRRLHHQCDERAVLVGIDEDLRDVITRLANRARTMDEADDVRMLIECRAQLAYYRMLIQAHHLEDR